MELIERFVNVVGWYKGILPAPGGKAANMYAAAPSQFFVKHKNGSGYRPIPGDIVVYAGAVFGHISIVESVQGNSVSVLEQNMKDEIATASTSSRARRSCPTRPGRASA